MINTARLDFEVHWSLKDFMEYTIDNCVDPFMNRLKSAKKFPYRVYLNDELLIERDFDIRDKYYIAETHWLALDSGQYTVRLEDLSGYMRLEIRDFKLNTVPQRSWVFNMP
jgi:hypothetical protein